MFGVKQVKFFGGGLPTLYLVMMLVLRPLELSTFLSTALSAPLFLLVPTGFGLLLCFGWTATLPSQLTRVQGFLIAYLFGTLFLVYLYVILERYGFTQSCSGVVFSLVYVAAMLGYLRLRKILVLEGDSWANFKLLFVICVPLLALRYIDQYVDYFEYPVIDLFQRVHFHKGAFEFANFGSLNPFVADSYIPFQQLFLGLMIKYAHGDPLVAEWLLPLTMEPLRIAGIYVLAEKFTKTKIALGLTIGLGLALSAVTNPTNGSIAEIAALLMLSMLWPYCLNARNRHVMWVLVATTLTVILARWIYALPVWASFLFLALVVPLALRFCRGIASLWVVPLLITALMMQPFHRGAMLFSGLIIGGGLFLLYLRHKSEQGASDSRTLFFCGGLFAILVMMVVRIFAVGDGAQDEFGLWFLFDYALKPLTGNTLFANEMSGDLISGVGGRVALFELARDMSFLVISCCVLFWIVDLYGHFKKTAFAPPFFEKVNHQQKNKKVIHQHALLLMCFFIMACILSGFPFIHRAAFIPALLVIIVFSNYFSFYSPLLSKYMVSAVIVATFAYALLIIWIIFFADQQGVSFLYVRFAEPVLILLMLCFTVTLLFVYRSNHKNRKIWIAAWLVLTVLFEGVASKAYFKSYAFDSQKPISTDTLAHYDLNGLDIANMLRLEATFDSVLLSDPKTLSLLKARTGLNTIVPFSNLDTMPLSSKHKLQRILNEVESGQSEKLVCGKFRWLANHMGGGERNYVVLKNEITKGNGSEALEILGFNNALLPKFVGIAEEQPLMPLSVEIEDGIVSRRPVELIIVYSPDTRAWLADRPSYFPISGSLPEKVATNISTYYRSAKLYKNTYVIKIQCR